LAGRRRADSRHGFQTTAFASGLNHPRWLYVLRNGDVLVAETNTPAKPDASPSLMERAMAFVMKRAGAGGPSPNRIVLLRDADGDGVAELTSTFLAGLNSPFGMALVGQDLYVADTDALSRFPYRDGPFAGGKPEGPRTFSPVSSTRTAARSAVQWAWPSIGPKRSSSPTMSVMPSGASRPPRP
jgi:glucose/arabinose dehydrogenase